MAPVPSDGLVSDKIFAGKLLWRSIPRLKPVWVFYVFSPTAVFLAGKIRGRCVC